MATIIIVAMIAVAILPRTRERESTEQRAEALSARYERDRQVTSRSLNRLLQEIEEMAGAVPESDANRIRDVSFLVLAQQHFILEGGMEDVVSCDVSSDADGTLEVTVTFREEVEASERNREKVFRFRSRVNEATDERVWWHIR